MVFIVCITLAARIAWKCYVFKRNWSKRWPNWRRLVQVLPISAKISCWRLMIKSVDIKPGESLKLWSWNWNRSYPRMLEIGRTSTTALWLLEARGRWCDEIRSVLIDWWWKILRTMRNLNTESKIFAKVIRSDENAHFYKLQYSSWWDKHNENNNESHRIDKENRASDQFFETAYQI